MINFQDYDVSQCTISCLYQGLVHYTDYSQRLGTEPCNLLKSNDRLTESYDRCCTCKGLQCLRVVYCIQCTIQCTLQQYRNKASSLDLSDGRCCCKRKAYTTPQSVASIFIKSSIFFSLLLLKVAILAHTINLITAYPRESQFSLDSLRGAS